MQAVSRDAQSKSKKEGAKMIIIGTFLIVVTVAGFVLLHIEDNERTNRLRGDK